MLRRNEPREGTDLAFEHTTPRGKKVRLLAVDSSIGARAMLAIQRALNVDVAGMFDPKTAGELKDENSEARKDLEAKFVSSVASGNGSEMLNLITYATYAKFGMAFYADDFDLETPEPRRPSAMTPAQWLEYAQSIEEELSTGIGRISFTWADVQSCVAALDRDEEDAIEQEKKA